MALLGYDDYADTTMATPDTDSKFRQTPNEFKLTIGQNEPLGAAFIPCPFVFLFIRRTDINVFIDVYDGFA